MDARNFPPLLRLKHIIGESAVSAEEAEANRNRPKTTTTHRPMRPRPATPGLLPIGKTTFYAGIKRGIFPKPYHLHGSKTAVWKLEELLDAIEKASA